MENRIKPCRVKNLPLTRNQQKQQGQPGSQVLKNIFHMLARRQPENSNEYDYLVFAVLLPVIQKAGPDLHII